MYTVEYKEKYDSRRENTSSSLYAKFNFRKEIPPNQRKHIRKRISSFIKERRKDLHIPKEYVLDGTKYDLNTFKIFGGSKASLTNKVLKFELLLSSNSFPVKNVINLGAINNYILTGKIEKD